MVLLLVLLAVGLTVFLMSFPVSAQEEGPGAQWAEDGEMQVNVTQENGTEYVGSETCKSCHEEQYDAWEANGHGKKLRPKSEVKDLGMPLPPRYSWDDVSYAIGGYGWKIRYVDDSGYILGTEDGWNQYDMEWERFSNYHKGESKKPYNCGKCHTTGFSEEGHQNGLEGIEGTWAEPGVGCEACHGPGGDHVESMDAADIEVDSSSELCGSCHYRDYKDDTVIASGGFIKHHEQFNEIQNSAHGDALSCTSCHDAHVGVQDAVKKGEFGYTSSTSEEFVGEGIDKECSSCHEEKANSLEDTMHGENGVSCTDCHMPEAAKSAHVGGGEEPLHEKGLQNEYLRQQKDGDIKSHLFRINTSPEAELLTDDGKYANGYLTVEWSCGSCHSARSTEWASKYAEKNIHSLDPADRETLNNELEQKEEELSETRTELQNLRDKVDELQTQLDEVQAQLNESQSDGATETGSPGFGIGVALLAILGGALVAIHRRR